MQNLIRLLEEYGSPLYVIDSKKLSSDVEHFNISFSKHIPNFKLAYSVKTNYLPWVCKKLFEQGCLPELISGFEIDLVEKLGYLNESALANGPMKTMEELERLIGADVNIQLDSVTELENIIELSYRLNKTAKVAFRLCPPKSQWKRFGIDTTGDDYKNIINLISNERSVRLVGLHCHLGTAIRNPDSYFESASFLSQQANALSLPYKLDYLNLGGGYPTKLARLNQVSENDWNIPEPEEFAKSIYKGLSKYLEKHPQTKVIIEPGRALVDESQFLLTKVIARRENDLILDAGKNILPSVAFRDHPITLLSNENEIDSRKETVNLFGPLCMGSDCFAKERSLPPLKAGDILKVDAVGAYGISQAMQFIRYQPAVIAIENGSVVLVRRSQDFQHLFSLDNWGLVNGKN